MIVTVHFLGNGILNNVEFGSFNTIIARGIECLAIVCINIFLLITGYFGITAKGINLRRIVNMLIMIAFFTVLSYLYTSIRQQTFSASKLLFSFAPYLVEGYWFVRVYLILVLITPYLNLGLNRLKSKSYLSLIIICYICFSVLPSFSKAFKNNDGYDIIHFVFMYVIGGYLRLHLPKKPNALVSIVLYGVFAFATFLFSVYGDNLGYWSYDFFTVIPEAVFLFLAFEQLKFNNKFLSYVAQSSLAVFVLENSILGLYVEIMNVKHFMETKYFIPHYLICVVGFTMFAFLIDCIRRVLFKYSIDKLLDRIPVINKRIFGNMENSSSVENDSANSVEQ